MTIRRRRTSRGGLIVVAGPDGSGKTTVSVALERLLAGERPVLHFHHRFRMLPIVAGGALVTEPHRQPPYPIVLSWMKSLYLYADYLLGWFSRVRPHVAKGGWVILERGWWDQIVDPRRYRLRGSSALLALLGHVLPKPDLVVVLHGSADLLFSRKSELPRAELERQQRRWRRTVPARVRTAFLDCAQPVEQIASAALAEAGAPATGAGSAKSGEPA